ncbi:helix-turn-helix domain-containing protein [Pseudomonas lurida]|nr:helix-turn-helix domain-containing protein [Pseudomonas lurida]MCF5307118.1 helix-turn-helix domain-containing protein [Pseudomonas lurida]MCF5326170.1 helix-turn-helix domain-containing protein [Pseudomonas lurida]
MIDQGDVARIGPHAFTVYAVIKAHANYYSGMANPGIERISEQSGVSLAQVKRALGVLETAGLITKTKSGRSNHYTLREKVQVTEAGLPHTVATWDYVPSRAQHTVSELKKALTAGDLASTRTLNIERLNIQINLVGGNSQIDLGSLHTDLDRLPAGIRETLRRNLNRRRDLIHSSE